jgi:serine protease Do
VTVVLIFIAGLALGAALHKIASPIRPDPAERAAEFERLATLDGTLAAFPTVARLVSDSVVSVTVERVPSRDWDFRMRAAPTNGSGFVVDEAGHVLTNHHVIEGATSVSVALPGGRTVAADIVGTDPDTDIAVLQVKAEGLVPAKLGDSDAIVVGEWVMAIGSPYGLSNTVTTGIVSAKGRSGVSGLPFEGLLQTDAAVNPGNSGGPLVNLKGEVVGITSSMVSRSGGYDGISFAIPINRAKVVFAKLLTEGRVVRGYLGAGLAELNADLVSWVNTYTTVRARDLDELRAKLRWGDSAGVFVTQVIPDAPADGAGLKLGDLIVDYDGRPVSSLPDLKERIAASAPGSQVLLRFIRNGKLQTATAVIALRGRTSPPRK